MYKNHDRYKIVQKNITEGTSLGLKNCLVMARGTHIKIWIEDTKFHIESLCIIEGAAEDKYTTSGGPHSGRQEVLGN